MGNSAAIRAGTRPSGVNDDGMVRPFGIVLRDLVLEQRITTGVHSPNWVEVAERLPGVHYETLRKAVSGDRAPAPKLMETVAEGFGVSPDIFYEYQLYQARLCFDPAVVGVEEALTNLEAWADAQASKRKKR